jgi:hypothetical protein
MIIPKAKKEGNSYTPYTIPIPPIHSSELAWVPLMPNLCAFTGRLENLRLYESAQQIKNKLFERSEFSFLFVF